MPDPATHDILLASGLGAAGAIATGSYSAMRETIPRKQVFATILLCLASGTFVSPAMVQYFQLNWIYAGCIGMVAGILCIPAVAGIKLVGEKFAIKPGNFIPQIRGAMDPESPDPKGDAK